MGKDVSYNLTPEEQKLVEAAQKVRTRAYARYSGRQVGAAVQTRTGKIFTGVNVESGSYSLTVCAERVAVFNAVTHGERELVAVAVASPDDRIWYPCGACRQVLADFSPTMTVFGVTRHGRVIKTDMRTLLPDRFILDPPDSVGGI